ncbi:lysM domain protein [Chlamydia ibidis]|uniref:LysM domain protein n=2 Tax=Chlamydia ibidis TaxID=1405396 RepID=S7J3C3_9CHLA|nr:LysM peptidoglycan-binding domain-containing protein [Chlamydia ibidis]EPP34532.1 lysM domain protein [Chlamydia ibidis]EQM62404.1 lysM domain protein [Chlamydia ibidis 10-1398/6]
MNRRDTIIIAAVVNAVLLLVLFTTAKHADSKNVDIPLGVVPSKVVEIAPQLEKVVEKSSEVVVEAGPQRIVKEELAAQFTESKPVVVNPVPISVAPQAAAPVKSPTVAHLTPANPEVSDSTKERESVHPSYTTIVVKKGDFLERIARANQTTVATLMQINDLSSTQLKIGQVIKVPVSDKVASPKNPQAKVVDPEDYYIVQDGDSPWTIALRHHIRLEELLKMNDLDEQKARKLRAGDRLRIR